MEVEVEGEGEGEDGEEEEEEETCQEVTAVAAAGEETVVLVAPTSPDYRIRCS